MMRRIRTIAFVVVALAGGVSVVSARTPEKGSIPDPCGVLTTADVQQLFPEAKAGELDRRQEKAGILKCTWQYPAGRLFVYTSDEITETPREEAENTWVLTFLDPLRNDAAQHVRYETLTGVGDQAVAVVEREDKSKGFSQSVAILVVRHGSQQVAVLSDELARRERADALRILGELGKAIARRVH
jgi:hypothetical protein